MALIVCPDCGNYVSDSAPSCPKCGKPLIGLKGNQIPAPVKKLKILKWLSIALGFYLLFTSSKAYLESDGRGAESAIEAIIIVFIVGLVLIISGFLNKKL